MENETIIIKSGTQMNPYPMLFTSKRHETNRNMFIITGCLPEHVWQIGDCIYSTHPLCPNSRVVEVLEQRDAKGIFDSPIKKKNSFFKLLVNTDATVLQPEKESQFQNIPAQPVEPSQTGQAQSPQTEQTQPAQPQSAQNDRPQQTDQLLTSIDDEFYIL